VHRVRDERVLPRRAPRQDPPTTRSCHGPVRSVDGYVATTVGLVASSVYESLEKNRKL
jgi:hypothetical protein